MCGKFTAMASWAAVVDFSRAFTRTSEGGGNDHVAHYRVGRPASVIVFDQENQERISVMMRWGWPKGRDPHAIGLFHCRSETLHKLPTFRDQFAAGQRGIVVVRTFNEARDILRPPKNKPTAPATVKETEQFEIDPGDDAPLGFAVLWDAFPIAGSGELLRAFIQCTVPANALIVSTDPQMDRMPAFLRYEDWTIWLGETDATLGEVQGLLQTMEGVHWKIAPEKRAPK
ncbi:MAG: SOS response-associated peptidase family protein [Rhizomicrobium sp.]